MTHRLSPVTTTSGRRSFWLRCTGPGVGAWCSPRRWSSTATAGTDALARQACREDGKEIRVVGLNGGERNPVGRFGANDRLVGLQRSFDELRELLVLIQVPPGARDRILGARTRPLPVGAFLERFGNLSAGLMIIGTHRTGPGANQRCERTRRQPNARPQARQPVRKILTACFATRAREGALGRFATP